VSDCNSKWAICQLYNGENKLHLMRRWWCLLCTIPTCLLASSLKQQSPRRHVPPILTYYLDSKPNCFCSYSSKLSREAVNTCFIVNSWFDPTSLVLLVEKTEENNRPVRMSLTNYHEVVSSTPWQRKRLEEHFL
jgi:hypothetical protein